MVERVIFYAVRVASEEIRRLVLPRSCCLLIYCLFNDAVSSEADYIGHA
jgi:hypothetical protein